MEDRLRRVVEYFAVAGLPDELRDLDHEHHHLLKSVDPITDVTVILRGQGELLPKGYQCVDTTPTGFPADLNHGSIRSPQIYLCYRRGRDKPPLADIGVLFEGKERVLGGCEVVHTTLYGRPAHINGKSTVGGPRTYITFRRASESGPHNTLAVTDICVILTNKGEKPPHAFCLIDKNLNKGVVGSDVYLCYKNSITKSRSLAYKAAILSRYPEHDYEHFPLPEQVPIFCLPAGATIECWPAKSQHPLPIFSTFVLTDATAQKVYGAAVTFHEVYPRDKLTEQQSEELGLLDQSDPLRTLYTIHTTKCICLLSHWPFFDAFKKFLKFLHSLSISGPHPIPIERQISHFMNDVPFPSPQRPRILVQLERDSIILCQPQHTPLPLSGASYTSLLRNLGPANSMTLLLLTLMEYKIVLHSLRPALLTEVAEAISTIIFPLHWQCPYIPVCPLECADVLSAPLPFIVGIDSRFFQLYDPPSDVTCIDLDTNMISVTEDRKPISWKLLPKKPTRILRISLELIFSQLAGLSFSDNPTLSDFAGDVAPFDHDFSKRKRQVALDMGIQEAFLHFMASLMKGYRSFLKPIMSEPTEGSMDTTSLFDVVAFIRSRDKSYFKFYSAFTKTQMFIRFLEERSFVSSKDTGLAFFDLCTDKVDTDTVDGTEVRLIEHDDSANSEHTVFVTPPAPVGDKKYSYTCFPKLDPELLRLHPNSSPLSTRPPKSFRPNSPVSRRTKHEYRASQKLARKHANSPVLWAKCLLGHCYSLWFINLPSYVNACHSKHRALRTAYDILVTIQSKQLQSLDEVCYRVMMQLCGLYGHPILAVKVLFEMKKCDITPNAITYGHYTKAVLENKWPTTRTTGDILWNRLRNVIIGVAQFKQGVKRSPFPGGGVASSSSEADISYRMSNESIPDSRKTNFVSDLIDFDSLQDVVKTTTPGSTTTTTTMTYTHHTHEPVTSGDESTQSDPVSTAHKSNAICTIVPESEDDDDEPFCRTRVSSIVRRSRDNMSSLNSLTTLRSASTSTAPVNIPTSSADTDDDDVFASPSSSGSLRKRHKMTPASVRRRYYSTGSAIHLAMVQQKGSENEPTSTLTTTLKNFGKDANLLSGVTTVEEEGVEEDVTDKPDNWHPLMIEDAPSSGPIVNGSKASPALPSRNAIKNSTPLKSHSDMNTLDEDLFTFECDDHPAPSSGRNAGIRNARKNLKLDMKLGSTYDGRKLWQTTTTTTTASTTTTTTTTTSSTHLIQSRGPSGDKVVSVGDHGVNKTSAHPLTRMKSTNSDGSDDDTHKMFAQILTSPTGEGLHVPSLSSVPSPIQKPSSPSPSPLQRQRRTPQNKESPGFPRFGSFRAAASAVASKIEAYTKTISTQLSTSLPNNEPYSDRSSCGESGGGSKRSSWSSEASRSETRSTDHGNDFDYHQGQSTFLGGSVVSLNGHQSDSGLSTSMDSMANIYKPTQYSIEVDISSCLQCYSCSSLLYDEEIMAGWTPDDSNLNTGCSHCSSLLVPFLNIYIRDLRAHSTSQSSLVTSPSPLSPQSYIAYPGSLPMAGSLPRGLSDHDPLTLCEPLKEISTSSVPSCENLLIHDTASNLLIHDTASNLLFHNTANNGSGSPISSSPAPSSQVKDLLTGSPPTCKRESTQYSATGAEPQTIPAHNRYSVGDRRRSASECIPTEQLKKTGPNQTGANSDYILLKSTCPLHDSFSVMSLDANSTPSSTSWASSPSGMNIKMILEPVSVPYLSPLVLRKEIENVVEHEGEGALLSPDFVDQHPIIYWNMIWYFKRLHLSSQLPGLLLTSKLLNKEQHPVSKSWLSMDSRHVLVRTLWDNLKFNTSYSDPLYAQWSLLYSPQATRFGSVISEQQQYSKNIIQAIVSSIQSNDVHTPITILLAEYGRSTISQSRRSIYREILFLAINSLNKDNIDHDAFDRQYTQAFKRLSSEEKEIIQIRDHPPNLRTIWCRRLFGQLLV